MSGGFGRGLEPDVDQRAVAVGGGGLGGGGEMVDRHDVGASLTQIAAELVDERGQPPEVTDRQALAAEVGDRSETGQLTQDGDPWPRARARGIDLERPSRERPADPVGGEPAVALKVEER